MALMETVSMERTGNVWAEPAGTDEVAALKHALSTVRRNPWMGAEVLDPEFENFMDAITRPASSTELEPVERDHHNPWNDFMDAAR